MLYWLKIGKGELVLKTQNLCKFPAAPLLGSALSVIAFVRETDAETMQEPTVLHAHRMLLVLRGNGSFSIDRSEYSFCAGALLFAFKGERFVLTQGRDVLYTYIDFEGARAEELLRRFNITALSRVWTGYDGLIPLWQESLSSASEKTIDLAAESILLYSFSRLFGAESERNGIIGKISEITERRFADAELSLSAIAEELSYHPKYLSHLFKEKMQITYSDYLRSVRIKFATTLFDHGIDSVKNVALLSGFSDPLYFSGVFKKCVGMSPKQYVESKNTARK